MKKLLFTLVAAAAGGVASAVAPTATFDGLTAFDPTVAESDGKYYWEIDISTDPELTPVGDYLQLNTGSTPLWRTFLGTDSPVDATNAALNAAGTAADGVVVSSDVKLTACTEWPTLTDFANEKLALFLFAPEEGDTSGKTAGLYAVGGAMVAPAEGEAAVLTPTAYKLTVAGNADITNEYGWAKITIKTYGDIYATSGLNKLAGFVIAVGNTVATRADATGFADEDLNTTAATRNADGTLIPAALATAAGTLQGLGFQGEGGIDNVNLAATAVDGMADAVTMTANITGATVTWTSTGTSLSGTTLTFLPGAAITFTVATDLDILTVKYNGAPLTAVDGVYTIESPAANATLEVKAEPALFEAGEVMYGSLEDALAALANGGTLKLLGALELGANLLTFDQMDAESGEAIDVVLDLNGQTISGSGTSDANAVIVVAGANLTIKDSVGGGKILPLTEGGYAVYNTLGALEIQAGAYDGAVVTDEGATTSITGGKFKVTEGLTPPDGMKFEQGEDNYYTLVEDAGEDPEPEVPTVGDGEGSVTVDETSGDATVAPAEGKTEVTITLPTGFAGNVIVPSSLDKIVGVPEGQLVIKSGDYVVTGAFSYDTETGAIALDEAGSVTIEGEPIPVKPALADGTGETPFEVGASGPEANVKAIPGLTYELILSDSVNGTYGSIVEGGDKTKVKATGKRVNLKDGRANRGAKGFYKVKVTK